MRAPPDPGQAIALTEEVARLAAHDPLLDAAAAQQLWRAVTGWPPERERDAYDTFTEALRIDADGELAFRPGAWTFDIRTAAAQSLLCSACLSGILVAAGYDQIPGYVLPTIMPIVFNLKAVRLSRQEDRLLAQLRLATDDDGKMRDAEDLYAALPKKVRKTVSKSEFSDFVDRLVAAGVADRPKDSAVRLRDEDNPVWIRISIG